MKSVCSLGIKSTVLIWKMNCCSKLLQLLYCKLHVVQFVTMVLQSSAGGDIVNISFSR